MRRRHQLGLEGSPGWNRIWANPGIPNRIDLIIMSQVSEHDRGRQQLRLVGSTFAQIAVDLRQNLPCLLGSGRKGVDGHLARQVDDITMDDRLVVQGALAWM